MNPNKETPLKFEDLFFATSRQFEKIIDQERESGKALKQQIREAKARHAQDLNEALARLKKYADAYEKQKSDFQTLKSEFEMVKQALVQANERENALSQNLTAFKERAETVTLGLKSELTEEQEENQRLSLELKETQTRMKAQVSFLQHELKDAKDQANRSETNYHELKHYSDSLKMRLEVELKEQRNQNHDLQQRIKSASLEMQSLQAKYKQAGEEKIKQEGRSRVLERKLEIFQREKEAFKKSEEDRQRLHVALMGMQQRLRDAERSSSDSMDEVHRLKLVIQELRQEQRQAQQLQSLPQSMALTSEPIHFEEEVMVGYPADQQIYS